MTGWIAADDKRLKFSSRLSDVEEAIAPLDRSGLRKSLAEMRSLLVERPEPLDRLTRPGHFTASALVVNTELDQILLLHHAKLKIWVQPGGHADGNANLMAVALREATEETGIAGLRIWPQAIDLDIHRVDPPTEDAHLHYDVRFVVLAPQSPVLNANHESTAQRWVSADDLPSMDLDNGLWRLTCAGLALARSLAGGGRSLGRRG